MAKQTVILAKTFSADVGVNGIGQCVVMSSVNPGNVALPAAALAVKFVGVTMEPIPSNTTTNAISVQTAGIAQVQTDGTAAIVAGDYLAIANVSGQVKTVVPASGTISRQLIGVALNSVTSTAGLLVDLLIQPMAYVGA